MERAPDDDDGELPMVLQLLGFKLNSSLQIITTSVPLFKKILLMLNAGMVVEGYDV